jgi:hypothetical protein
MSNVTGELGGQPIILENAASEATLNALLQATLANSSSKSQAAKIQKAYEDAVKKTTDSQNKNIDTLKKAKESQDAEIAKRKDLNKKIEEEKEKREKLIQGFKELGAVIGKIGDVVGKTLGYAFNNATPKVTDFTDALSGVPLLGPAIGAMGKALQDNMDIYRSITTVGADFAGSMSEMKLAVTQTGLSYELFSKTVVENNRNFSGLGNGAAAGAKAFAAINASMRGPFREGLARLGISMEEQADLTAGYLSQQISLGRAQRMTQEQLNEGAQQYVLELDQLTRVHGMSRKQAQESLIEVQQDKRMKLLFAKIGEAGGETGKILTGIMSKNKTFAAGMMDLISTNGVYVAGKSSAMAEAIALNSPGLVNLAKKMARNGATQDEANRIIREEMAIRHQSAVMDGDNQALFAALGSNIYDLNAIAGEFLNYGLKPMAEATGDQTDTMNNGNNAMLGLNDRLQELRDTIMIALEPILGIFADTLTASIPEITKFVNEFTAILQGEDGLPGALKFGLSKLAELVSPFFIELFKQIFTSPAVIGAMLVGVGALWAYSAVKIAMIKGIENALGDGKTPKYKPGQFTMPGGWKDGGGPSSKLPQGPSTLSRIGGLLKGGGLLGLGGMGVEYVGEKVSEAGHKKTGAALDIAGSTAKYAGLGALAGSFIPGVGTLIGGGIGGVIGLGAGLFSSGGKLFGGSSSSSDASKTAVAEQVAKTSTPESRDTAVAAQVAKTTTPAQVKELSAALKDLDYGKLIVPDEAHQSMETGVIKMRQLRGEVNAMTTAFKELNNTGLDKITQGLGRLDESFKSFNKSFVEDFMAKFKELDKKSQEQLLSDLNEKMEMLNTNMKALVDLEEENSKHHKNTARNTRTASGRVN